MSYSTKQDQRDYLHFLQKLVDNPDTAEHIREEALFLIEHYEKELNNVPKQIR